MTLLAYPLAFLLVATLAPLLFAISLLRDVIGAKQLATTRGLLFILFYLGCELAGIAASFWIWSLSKLTGNHELALDRYSRLQWWWTDTLFASLCRVYQLEVSVSGVEDISLDCPQLVWMRHSSMADTLLPGALLSSRTGLRLRYVLKRELLWDPCLDLVGQKLPNVFVDRIPEQGGPDIERVGQLAQSMEPGDGVLLYPEGTRFSISRRKKILEQLHREGGSRLAASTALRHVLPPRRGGALALLKAAPDADVTVCVHHGLERVAGFGDLLSGALIGQTIEVEFWSIPRSSIPVDEAGRCLWLDDVWSNVDEWLEERSTTTRTPT